jgi:pyridoxal phosphate enzyme (YggS family)
VNGRRAELEDALGDVRARIAAAATAASRAPGDVELVVITKTYPASDVDLLAGLGIRHVGENRHPEARDKRTSSTRADDLVWHFVGQLQTNKAKAVAGYADVVESVDRERLVTALARGAEAAERTLRCLIQVDLDEGRRAERSGCLPVAVPELADAIEAAPALVLAGVMAVAPLGGDPARAFGALAEVAARMVADHPAATTISAGMSGDLEEAIAAGATHVRVGRAVLGERPPTG